MAILSGFLLAGLVIGFIELVVWTCDGAGWRWR